MRVRVVARGVPVDVWTTHLSVTRGKQAQAEDVSEIIGAPRCATVVGVDLNAGPGSPEDRLMRTHLRDTWRVVGRGPGFTNFRQVKRIDYLYYDRGSPREAWVTPQRSSDHRGVVAVIALEPRHDCR